MKAFDFAWKPSGNVRWSRSIMFQKLHNRFILACQFTTEQLPEGSSTCRTITHSGSRKMTLVKIKIQRLYAKHNNDNGWHVHVGRHKTK